MSKEKFGTEQDGLPQEQMEWARDLTVFLNTGVEAQYDVDPDLPDDPTDKRILRSNEHGLGEHSND